MEGGTIKQLTEFRSRASSYTPWMARRSRSEFYTAVRAGHQFEKGLGMPSHDRFRQELRAQIHRGVKRGASQIIVNSAKLRLAVTMQPQPDQMQCCRDVMREEMRPGDSILNDCESEGLTIRYVLPSAT